MGFEDGGAGLKGRGDCVFEGHLWFLPRARQGARDETGLLGADGGGLQRRASKCLFAVGAQMVPVSDASRVSPDQS